MQALGSSISELKPNVAVENDRSKKQWKRGGVLTGTTVRAVMICIGIDWRKSII